MKIYIAALLAMFIFTGCLKNNDLTPNYDGITPLMIIPNANYPIVGLFSPALKDSAYGVTKLNLTASYAFGTPAPRDIKVTFTRNDALITAYNAQFFAQYLPLPAAAYQVSGLQVTIPAGSQSVTLPITINPASISGTNKYIIAFTLNEADGVTIGANYKNIIFTLKGQ